VNSPLDGIEDPLALAARELADLLRLSQEARVELEQLRTHIAAARRDGSQLLVAQLLAANEELVCSALQSRTVADSCRDALQQVARSAERDALTELPNRVLFLVRLVEAIAQAREHGTRLSLLFLDLDNFKQVNDSLGHAVGDEVLKWAAQRLSTTVRDGDTVCRYGGDEFLILLKEVSPAESVRIAHSLIASLAVPSRVAEHAIWLTASVGISLYPEDGDDVDTLIRHADAAMYRAKRDGLGTFISEPKRSAEGSTRHSPLQSPLQRRHDRHEQEAAGTLLLQRHLQEANEQLIMTALDAAERQSDAQQSQRSQQELLAMVAHELRSPLTPIRMAAGLLDRVRAQELPEMRAIIEREVVHMLRLIEDLLDLSRVNTGKLRLVRREIDLVRIVDDAISVCRPAMEAREQRLAVDRPSQPVVFSGDAVRLSQVLRNLLDNATKYTPERGDIRVLLALVGEHAVVTVSDSGIGITADALTRVFHPFEQDPHAITFNGAGLGIGLALVRELVAAHGGTVAAFSEGTGLGSQFVVTLPLSGAAPAVDPGIAR
jgi:diguanylate cyclase